MRLVGLVLMSLLCAAMAAESSHSKLTPPISPGSELKVEQYTPGKITEFDNVISRFGMSALLPYTFVVSNDSSHAILAVTVIWDLEDSGGKHSQIVDATDSLFLVNDPVVGPRERLMISPAFMLAQTRATTGFSIGGPSVEQALQQYDGSARVVARIDTIVFDDGKVIGSDASGTVESIKGRKLAADMLTAKLSSFAKDRGQFRSQLQRLSDEETVGTNVHKNRWTRRFVRQLQRSEDCEAELNLLTKLPKLPPFHR